MERLDADVLRRWVALATRALEDAAPRIDALNVFPVPDSDTGTNVLLTIAEAERAVRALPADSSLQDVTRHIAQASLLGARGNSGVILSQFLHGVARAAAQGAPLAVVLRTGHTQAVLAVARPAPGTILTAADAAASAAESSEAAQQAAGRSPDPAQAALAALEAARDATRRSPSELAVLRVAGVVDAGASAFVVLLEALVETLTGAPPAPAVLEPELAPGPDGAGPDGAGRDGPGRDAAGEASAIEAATVCPGSHDDHAGDEDGEFEVMFLVEAEPVDGGVAALDSEPTSDLAPLLGAGLSAIGSSVAVVGGYGRWQAHVHTDDPAAALRADGGGWVHRALVRDLLIPAPDAGQVGVVAVVDEPGLAADLARAGAVVQVLGAGEVERLTPGDLARAVVDARSDDVLVLAADPRVRAAARALAADPAAHGAAYPEQRDSAGPAVAVAEVTGTAQVVAAVSAVAALHARGGADAGTATSVAEAVVGADLDESSTAAQSCAALEELHARCPVPEVLVVLCGPRTVADDAALEALVALAHALELEVVVRTTSAPHAAALSLGLA